MLLSFNKCPIFCIDCAYLSVNRVNGIGENSNVSSKRRSELHCASPIPYHVFFSCEYIRMFCKQNVHAETAVVVFSKSILFMNYFAVAIML